MPRIITQETPPEHLGMQLVETEGPNQGSPVIAERVLDITDICGGVVPRLGQQALVKYGKVNRGVIAQIQDRYVHGEDDGSETCVFPDELGIAGMVTTDHFVRRAQDLGCDVMKLAETVAGYMPATDKK